MRYWRFNNWLNFFKTLCFNHIILLINIQVVKLFQLALCIKSQLIQVTSIVFYDKTLKLNHISLETQPSSLEYL